MRENDAIDWAPPQAYTSQIIALVMFVLMVSEDLVSMQPRRKQIIDGLKQLPGTYTGL